MNAENAGQTIQDALAVVRQKIDTLDATMLEMLNQRAQCAREVGEIKARFGDDGFIYRPEREAQVLRRLQALNQGPLADETITRLFREVMSACLALEQPIGVAFLGPLGTSPNRRQSNSLAMRHACCRKPRLMMCSARSRRDTRITPWCRSKTRPKALLAGTLDLLLGTSLKICGEVVVRIHQNLLSRATI